MTVFTVTEHDEQVLKSMLTSEEFNKQQVSRLCEGHVVHST